MKSFAILILAQLVLSCSSVYFLRGDDFSNKEIDKELQNKSVSIKLNNKNWIDAEIKTFTDSVMTYVENDSMEMSCVSFEDIEIIRLKNHGKGALQGAGLGLLIGGVVGVAVAGSGGHSSGFVSSEAMYGGLIIIGSPVIGAVLGGITGADEIYLFSQNNLSEAEMDSILNPEDIIKIENVRITEESIAFIWFIWKGEKISLRKSDIQKIEKINDHATLYITRKIYDKIFEKL